MKIDPPAPPTVPFTRSNKGAAKSSGTDAAQSQQEAAASGQVRLMPSSTAGDFDAARVAAIREDIRAGRYQVNPERIADGLIDSVQELLQDKK